MRIIKDIILLILCLFALVFLNIANPLKTTNKSSGIVQEVGVTPTRIEALEKFNNIDGEASMYKILNIDTISTGTTGTLATIATYENEDGQIKTKKITDAFTIGNVEELTGSYLMIKKIKEKEYLYIIEKDTALCTIV